jgi:orotidine-5'-phosphate decarboxylase
VASGQHDGKLIVGLDVPTRDEALRLAGILANDAAALKVGMELLYAEGPSIVDEVIEKTGARVFVDSKFHDIPNTVAGAARSITAHKPWMFNVHCSGGKEMMSAAAKAADERARELRAAKPLVIGVTVLTSIDEAIMRDELGVDASPADQVAHLARLAKEAGLDGVVASPLEIETVRSACGEGFLIVTPGIRPEWSQKGDQKRVMTPKEAIAKGADYIVVSRPVIKADDPLGAAHRILEEMAA